MVIANTAQGGSGKPPVLNVRELVLVALAAVKAMNPAELDREIESAGGDAEVDSPQAEVIMARLETHFGCKLPGVSDLDPEQFNSISALVSLIERRLAVGGSTTTASPTHLRDTGVRVA